MTDQQARAVLNTWGHEKLLKVNAFGDSLKSVAITNMVAHRLVIQSQVEHKTPGTIVAPAPVHERSLSHVPLPNAHAHAAADVQRLLGEKSFVKATHHVIREDSHRVAACQHCQTTGQVRCTSCGGRGHNNCPFCGGFGMKNVSRTRSVRGPNGQTRFESYMSREACGCAGGKVPCASCHRTGKTTCHACAGHGATHQWDSVMHAFEAHRQELFHNGSDLADDTVLKAEGQNIHDAFWRTNDAMPDLPAPLLTECRAGLMASFPPGTVLYRHLAAWRIPVSRVEYSVKNGRGAHLWIYGTTNLVHAPSESGLRGIWHWLRK